MKTRQLRPEEEVPYDLLLLADETVEAIDKYITDCDIYLLDIDETIVAVYALQVIDKEQLEIKIIAISKNYQGRGIGKFLIQESQTRATEQRFRINTIGTGETSIRQLDLYQKLGFEKFETKHNFFIDNYPQPIFENGTRLKHMIMLRKYL